MTANATNFGTDYNDVMRKWASSMNKWDMDAKIREMAHKITTHGCNHRRLFAARGIFLAATDRGNAKLVVLASLLLKRAEISYRNAQWWAC